MPALINMPRAAWKRQPQVPVEANWGNSLTKGMLAFSYQNSASYRGNKSPLALNGNAMLAPTTAGVGLLCAGIGDYAAPITTFSPPTVVGAMLCMVIPHSFTSTIGLYGYSSVSIYAGYNLTLGSTYIDLLLGTGEIASPSARRNHTVSRTQNAGELTTFVFSTLSLTASLFAVNGQLLTPSVSGSAGSYTAGVNNVSIGRRGSGDAVNYFYGNKTVLLLVSWSRSLSSFEAEELTTNPWQLFAPAPSRFYLIPTTALPTLSSPTAINITAGGFQPRVTATY